MSEVAQTAKAKAQEKLKALGFKKERSLGFSILELKEGDSVMVKITSEVLTFTSKDEKEFDYVEVTNLETGEADMRLWMSGQLKYQLQKEKNGFVGGDFMITHLGKTKVDDRYINQFDIIAISQ